MKGFSSLGVVGICAVWFLRCDAPAPSNLHSSPAPLFSSSPPAHADSNAFILAQKIFSAAGGEKFNAVNYISFHFVIASDTALAADWRHDWDRRKNRYRLEGRLAQGDHVLVLMHLNQQTGRAFRNGRPVPAEEARPLLAMAYSRFLSDFYWLLLPFKLQDPGVRLEYQGVQKVANVSCEVLRLSFAEQVGLTPENSYRLFIDPETFHLRRWEFYAAPQSAPLVAWWENWRDFGGIALATERRLEGTDRRILFEEIVVSAAVDESLFAVPAEFAAELF